jgi:hypothetical protein
MSLLVDVEIESMDTAVKQCTQALIDCGATGCFIAPVSRSTVSTPVITATAARNIPTTAVKNTAASDPSGPQYRYSTPIEDPAIILKVFNRALDVPVSITQWELLSISPEAQKQYKELTTTQ